IYILIHRSLSFIADQVLQDLSERYIIVFSTCDREAITLVNTYSPNIRSYYFSRFISLLSPFLHTTIIFGGDFNLVLDPKLDRSHSATVRISRSQLAVHELLTDLSLFDTWRIMHTYKTSLTIDYILVPQSLLSRLVSTTIHPIVLSDHALVSITYLPLSCPTKNTGWKFNNFLLNNKECCSFISDLIKENKGSVSSVALLWGSLKCVLRGNVISFNTAPKLTKWKQFLDLMSKIKDKPQDLKIPSSLNNTLILVIHKKVLTLKRLLTVSVVIIYILLYN
uniref:Endonuclease/exonuclease/phosphatase domain-containing protein n=1 Tax=Latimeria chalumnae TaxID=7897 RepID=H3B2K4_LATCH